MCCFGIPSTLLASIFGSLVDSLVCSRLCLRVLGIAAWTLLLGSLSACGSGDRSDILILVRAGDPVSRAIAEDYAAARDLSEDQILELTLTSPRDAVEIDAASYLREIASPIESHLETADPDREVSILITTRGLPLRIGHCDSKAPHYPKNCQSAAVDAALAQLGRTGAADLAFRRVENPLFRDPRSFDQLRQDDPDGALRFLVARLSAQSSSDDDPEATPRVLREVIDRPVPTELPATPALWRVDSENPRSARTPAAAALLDSIESQLPLFGHRVCDGCPDPPEDSPPNGIVLQTKAPNARSTQSGDPLVYPGFVIRLDAGGIDLAQRRASTSALDASRNSSFDRFVSDWFGRGASAISTHLADPNLANVTRPTAQLKALARGSFAVEAHFKSVPQLGWVNVFIGDPLVGLYGAANRAEGTSSHHPSGSQDRDRDGVVDESDNCVDDPNPDQRDTNADGVGNLCDPDVNDDGRVDTSWGTIYPLDRRGDLEAISLTARNGPYDVNHDLDGDGRVDERDVVRAQLWLDRTPGR